MSFFKKLFGASEEPTEEKAAKDAERRFNILCDDGLRAKQMGMADFAEKCFTEALEIKRELRVVGFLAEVQLMQQNYAAALPLLQELHAEEAGNLEIGLLLANTYGETEDYESMQQICTALAESEAKEPRLLYLSAKAAYALDKHEEALNFLDDAISERADYAQAIQLRVKVLSALGRHDEALADAERLLKETPDHEDYALLQAETLAAAGRCAEAESACQKVSELNPFNIEAHALLSRLAEQREDLAKAITHCDDAIALQPANPNLYDRRAALFRKNNAPEAAEKDEKKAADLRAGEHDEQ